jgi:xanthine/CO dehydrogenase XdhC/CoxF family maturation factor
MTGGLHRGVLDGPLPLFADVPWQSTGPAHRVLLFQVDQVDERLLDPFVVCDRSAIWADSDVRGMLVAGRSAALRYGLDGRRRGEGMTVFVNSFKPPPRMLVFGAIDFAAAVARLGRFLGYGVTVCDARPVFATHSRFPDADDVVIDWPHRYLRQEADAGLTEDELTGLASPIGLDLGARTPEETAVSIAAEIIALRWGGRGERLVRTQGPIHRNRNHIVNTWTITEALARSGSASRPRPSPSWPPTPGCRDRSCSRRPADAAV